MRNLDDTLEHMDISNDTDEYIIADAEKYKGLDKNQFADPANRAFPIDTEAHVNAAMGYLNQFYNNRPKKGVTADYSEEKFKSVHNRILRAMKKFGIEHKGCSICGKNESRKGASSMEKPTVQNEGDTEEMREEITEPTETAEDTTPADSLVMLEASLAEKEVEIKSLSESLAKLQEEHEQLQLRMTRLVSLASRGISVSPEMAALIGKLGDDEFGMLESVLISRMTGEESVEEQIEEEPIVEESEETPDTGEHPVLVESSDEETPAEDNVETASEDADESEADESEETEEDTPADETASDASADEDAVEEETEEPTEDVDAALGSLNIEDEPNTTDANYWKKIHND